MEQFKEDYVDPDYEDDIFESYGESEYDDEVEEETDDTSYDDLFKDAKKKSSKANVLNCEKLSDRDMDHIMGVEGVD